MPGDKGFKLVQLVGYLEYSMTVITTFYFIFAGLFKRKKLIEFIERLQKVDETMKVDLKIMTDYSMFRINSLAVLVATLLYYYVIVSIVMYSSLLKIDSMFRSVTFFVYISLSTTSGVFTFCFVAYVSLVYAEVTKVNARLAEIMRFPPEVLEKIYKSKDALCDEMLRYSKAYKGICCCVDDLNTVFGSSLVLHFAHDFSLLTTQVFAMFHYGLNVASEDSLSFIPALMIWTLPNVLKISAICLVCHLTTNKV